MSFLDDQLKELQGRKLKVEFFKLLKSKIGDVSADKFKSIEKCIKDELFAFIDAQVHMIENGEIKEEKELDTLFSDEQVKALMVLADKVNNKAEIPKPNTPLQKPVEQPVDKVSFALQHRHLDGKEVRIKSLEMAQGVVKGIDAPYIVVQLLTGQIAKVPLTDLVL